MLRLIFAKTAEESLDRLSPVMARRILAKIKWLTEHFDQIRPESLAGDFHDFLKLRVGDWRVLYEVDRSKGQIVIQLIGHRSSIYDR